MLNFDVQRLGKDDPGKILENEQVRRRKAAESRRSKRVSTSYPHIRVKFALDLSSSSQRASRQDHYGSASLLFLK